MNERPKIDPSVLRELVQRARNSGGITPMDPADFDKKIKAFAELKARGLENEAVQIAEAKYRAKLPSSTPPSKSYSTADNMVWEGPREKIIDSTTLVGGPKELPHSPATISADLSPVQGGNKLLVKGEGAVDLGQKIMHQTPIEEFTARQAREAALRGIKDSAKQVSKNIGKKVLGAIPLVGGAAMGLATGDAFASVPVVGDLLQSDPVGEGSDKVQEASAQDRPAAGGYMSPERLKRLNEASERGFSNLRNRFSNKPM